MKYLLLLLLSVKSAQSRECEVDEECNEQWPKATCRNGRCACPPNTLKRKSDSYGWVCLSLVDATTGQLGPPVTCPFPEGAGYRSVLDRPETVFCKSKKKNSCPASYECIKTIGIKNAQGDGVCCPRRGQLCIICVFTMQSDVYGFTVPSFAETTCKQKVSESPDGWVFRWYFNGSSCEQFKWNPEKNSTANNFVTKKLCVSYCADYAK
ncbi:unnamed protein product [Anisakis simplex]|uniref:BPTI/Kunitz inhibitor domain-containing protein n=1 Tax=Anisakis simplex TaxID=6269 RepID=A0A0M3JUG5_ANISI|nr:unnamed protein product [Anisakis simplex]